MPPKPDPRSFAVTVLLVMLVAYGPVSTDMYLPSLPAITAAFGASVAEVQLTLSVFVAGFAVAQLVYGPLSDRFGRRPVLLVGLAFYVVASAACMLANSIETLLIARFVQSWGACAAPVLGRAVVRDVYDRGDAAKMYAYMASARAVAPLVAPVFGGWLQEAFGWQANFFVLAAFGVVVLVLTWGMLAETNAYRDPDAFDIGRMLRNYACLLKSREFLGHTLVLGFSFAGLFSFISGSSFTMIEALGMQPSDFGYAFAVVVGGFVAGSYGGGRVAKAWGPIKLEARGLSLMVVGAGAAAGLAWAGVQTIAAVIGPLAFFFMGCGLTMPNAMAGAIGPFPRMAGAASALAGFIQMGSAAIAGVMVGHLFDGTTRAMPSLMLATGLLAGLAFLTLVKGRARPA